MSSSSSTPTLRRALNFGAGPAALPLQVLQTIQQEMLDWNGSGMSVMELSHRSPQYESIIKKAEQDLRDLMNIPNNYKVLFMQGGGTAQFAAVAMNLLLGPSEGATADYVITGEWSKKAAKEAQKYGKVNVVASGESNSFRSIPPVSEWKLSSSSSSSPSSSPASYLYYCANETVNGVEFQCDLPDLLPEDYRSKVPIVADMSSNILSRAAVDVSKYGLIYAGAQKNIGIAGVTVVIVKEELLQQRKSRPETPLVLDYKVTSDSGSMYNTPPTFSIYVAGLVFQWIKQQGGVKALEERNIRKSRMLYEAIDSSPDGFYSCPVDPSVRSRMNVVFRINCNNNNNNNNATGEPQKSLESQFVKEAESQQPPLVQLAGHRSVGGLRASLYNAMDEHSVQQLVQFMHKFQLQQQQQQQ